MRKEVFFKVLKNDVKKIVNSPKRLLLILSTILGISSGSKIAKGENMPIDLPQQTPIEQQNEIKAKSKAEERYNWKDEGKTYRLFDEVSLLTLNVDYKVSKFLTSLIITDKKDKKIVDEYGNVITIDSNNVTITDKNNKIITIDVSSVPDDEHLEIFFHYITGEYLYLITSYRTFFNYSMDYFCNDEIVKFGSAIGLNGGVEELPNYNELKEKFNGPIDLDGVVDFMDETGFYWHTTVEKPYVPSGKIPMDRAEENIPVNKVDFLLIVIKGDLTVVPTQTAKDKKNKTVILEVATGVEIADPQLKKFNPKFLAALGIKKASEMKASFIFANAIGKSQLDSRLADLTLPIRRAEIKVNDNHVDYNLGKFLEAYDRLPEDLKFDYEEFLKLIKGSSKSDVILLRGTEKLYVDPFGREHDISQKGKIKSL